MCLPVDLPPPTSVPAPLIPTGQLHRRESWHPRVPPAATKPFPMSDPTNAAPAVPSHPH